MEIGNDSYGESLPTQRKNTTLFIVFFFFFALFFFFFLLVWRVLYLSFFSLEESE